MDTHGELLQLARVGRGTHLNRSNCWRAMGLLRWRYLAAWACALTAFIRCAFVQRHARSAEGALCLGPGGQRDIAGRGGGRPNPRGDAFGRQGCIHANLHEH